MKNTITLCILVIFLVSSVSAMQVCQTYDNFSSGVLDTDKWEIRQDVEGQPFTGEYWIDSDLNNFHTQQNIIGDRRTYLFPKRNFTTGDVLEYDAEVISKEGNWINMILLTRDQYTRIGGFGYINGVQCFDELGTSHIQLIFEENQLIINRESPFGQECNQVLPLSKLNGNYELYIGTVSGHNGRVHMDYDNFELCTEQPEPTCDERVVELETQVNELTARVSFLESLVEKLDGWLWFLKNKSKKDMLCETLDETGEKEIIQYGMNCWIDEVRKKGAVCRCKSV